MNIIKDPKQMHRYSEVLRVQGKKIAFVPTMGFLHEGHLSLVDIGRKLADEQVLSIFVNPTQFAPNEDYEQYPRDWDRDFALAEKAGVDTIYAPTAKEMYPENYDTYIQAETLQVPLCGVSRPAFFRGVATVCTKLFNAIKPHYAIFGEKDYQQLLVIRRVVEDLDMDLEIIGGPTVREKDGLAMSSRNVYLSPEERAQAVVLSRSLAKARELTAQGETGVKAILDAVKSVIAEADLARPDYIELRTLPMLRDAKKQITGPTLLALAILFGKTRLIDNTILLGDQ